MSIKVTHNPDGSIEVECNGQRVVIQPAPPVPVPITSPIDPFGGGSPGAMLTMPIDVGRLLASGSRFSRIAAFADPGGSIRKMLEELSPQPARQAHLLLRLPRGRSVDLAEFSALIEALEAEGIVLKIVAEG